MKPIALTLFSITLFLQLSPFALAGVYPNDSALKLVPFLRGTLITIQEKTVFRGYGKEGERKTQSTVQIANKAKYGGSRLNCQLEATYASTVTDKIIESSRIVTVIDAKAKDPTKLILRLEDCNSPDGISHIQKLTCHVERHACIHADGIFCYESGYVPSVLNEHSANNLMEMLKANPLTNGQFPDGIINDITPEKG